jgi:hypothetical protein
MRCDALRSSSTSTAAQPHHALQGCKLYVMDACASVTIDDCRDCTIFIGPTEASVFIRDCSGCTFAVISRQLRCVGEQGRGAAGVLAPRSWEGGLVAAALQQAAPGACKARGAGCWLGPPANAGSEPG